VYAEGLVNVLSLVVYIGPPYRAFMGGLLVAGAEELVWVAIATTPVPRHLLCASAADSLIISTSTASRCRSLRGVDG
jgi:hypothetical protein